MHNRQGEETRRQIIAVFEYNPAPSLEELCQIIQKVKSTALYRMARLVADGRLIEVSGPRSARRWRLSARPDPLHTAARLLVARAERRGRVAVVPWAAVEAMREALG